MHKAGVTVGDVGHEEDSLGDEEHSLTLGMFS